MKQVLALSHVRKSYDGRVVLDDVTLAFLPAAKVGMVGPNGTGKSTLLRLMAGVEGPGNGEVLRMPGYSVGILLQEPSLDDAKTVLGNVEDGVAGTRALLDRYGEITAEMAADYSDELVDELGQLQERLDHLDAWDLGARLEQAMDALRCPPPDADVGMLSGGERGRMNLALTLRQGGNLLLLDEPANDLDTETLASLENALLEFPGCAMITSHDRWFLDRVATHILAWEEDADWFWFEGNFAGYEQNKTARLGQDAVRPHRVTYRKLTR